MLTQHILIFLMVTRYASHMHRIFFIDLYSSKAMAIVTDRLNANKPATPEPKGGKVTAAQLNNNKDLEVDMKKDEPSFFGSFFSSAKSQQQKAKKGPQTMEAPPTVIRPQAALNERETLETEVISASRFFVSCSTAHLPTNIYQSFRRAAHPLVL
jgi:vacuolar protein sorting-associated protein 1